MTLQRRYLNGNTHLWSEWSDEQHSVATIGLQGYHDYITAQFREKPVTSTAEQELADIIHKGLRNAQSVTTDPADIAAIIVQFIASGRDNWFVSGLGIQKVLEYDCLDTDEYTVYTVPVEGK
jgi:hypothetical protein